MEYIVYIICSKVTGKFYIGYTLDITKRMRYHNAGKNKSTKNDRPWKIVYTESYQSKTDALKREKKIKSYKSGNSFKKLINQAGIV